MSQAMNQIVRNFYVRESKSFEIVICEKMSKSDTVRKFINKIEFPTKIIQKSKWCERPGITESPIVFFKTIAAYNKFVYYAQFTNNFLKKFDFVIFIEELDEKSLKSIRPSSKLYHCQVFLVKSESGLIKLMTYTKFNKPNCDKYTWKTINVFSTTQ
jgi:hypothetical protein